MAMTSRDRFLAALNGETPDRTPLARHPQEVVGHCGHEPLVAMEL